MKKLLFSQKGDPVHWVGDGFRVSTIFSYGKDAKVFSPFLLMDYAEPTEFPPGEHKRGVGEHPHRGFETVTIMYAGEVEHRDSQGGGGRLGPGDVQWMTAGSGLVHEESHGNNFGKTGGMFEVVQLWVNLPAKVKMTKPKYQEILSEQIPRVELPAGAGYARIIAGELGKHRGPATTFTPINLWDLQLNKGQNVDLQVPSGHTALIFVLSGEIVLPEGEKLASGFLGVFDKEDSVLSFAAVTHVKALILTGEPILEPVVGYGPFVMNSKEEIQQAMVDYHAGHMGALRS